jgi:hypothetical protein
MLLLNIKNKAKVANLNTVSKATGKKIELFIFLLFSVAVYITINCVLLVYCCYNFT